MFYLKDLGLFLFIYCNDSIMIEGLKIFDLDLLLY